ncbi:MAG: GatB/YqeY domain-containing protein [Marinibacterium sp.]|nr:GatB/YqeY domain-containing protein [Marinibacterium sp.]
MTDMRTQINAALKQAMKDKAADRLSTLRLINAAIKDKDIAARGAAGGSGESAGIGDAELLSILGKMTKQRQESARAYEEGGRLDLAEREQAEIAIISEFLPKQLDEGEVDSAIRDAMARTGAASIRDMGKVMAELKTRYTGQMDFGKVGPMVKSHLCSAAPGQC